LKQHSSYSDAWISINGVVYDITNFIDKHPFGDTFRGNLGAECGGLFSSAHLNTKVEEWIKSDSFLKKNGIKVVGHLDASNDRLRQGNKSPFLDRIVYVETGKDEFWQDLKTNVATYLKESGESTHYTSMHGAAYICYFLCIHLTLCYLTWVKGSFLAAIVLGVHAIYMLANISHMATHSGFTRSSFLDFVAMHLFDMCGSSGLEWQITHQTHHNQPHSSIDHQTNTYELIGVRIHKHQKYKGHHRYQYIYFWIMVSIYMIYKFILTTGWLFKHREFLRHKYDLLAHFLAKGFFFMQLVYGLQVHGLWTGLAIFGTFVLAFSLTAFMFLFNDHEENHEMLGEVEDVRHYQGKLSWAEAQVRTSGNWYPTSRLSSSSTATSTTTSNIIFFQPSSQHY
jgi:hypothetical protein